MCLTEDEISEQQIREEMIAGDRTRQDAVALILRLRARLREAKIEDEKDGLQEHGTEPKYDWERE